MKGKVLINLLIGYLSLTDLVCGGGDVWFWLIHQPPLDPNFSLHLYLVISSRPVGIAANNDAMIKHSPSGLSLRYFSLETFLIDLCTEMYWYWLFVLHCFLPYFHQEFRNSPNRSLLCRGNLWIVQFSGLFQGLRSVSYWLIPVKSPRPRLIHLGNLDIG